MVVLVCLGLLRRFWIFVLNVLNMLNGSVVGRNWQLVGDDVQTENMQKQNKDALF